MSLPRAVFVISLLMFSAVSPVAASRPGRVAASARLNVTMRTFMVRVLGHPDRRATFWVAYGPLDGEFGMLQLRRDGRTSVYRVTAPIPSHGRTVFAYLQGQGVVHTRAGDGPAEPIFTIAQVGPVSASHAKLPTIAWRAPVG